MKSCKMFVISLCCAMLMASAPQAQAMSMDWVSGTLTQAQKYLLTKKTGLGAAVLAGSALAATGVVKFRLAYQASKAANPSLGFMAHCKNICINSRLASLCRHVLPVASISRLFGRAFAAAAATDTAGQTTPAAVATANQGYTRTPYVTASPPATQGLAQGCTQPPTAPAHAHEPACAVQGPRNINPYSLLGWWLAMCAAWPVSTDGQPTTAQLHAVDIDYAVRALRDFINFSAQELRESGFIDILGDGKGLVKEGSTICDAILNNLSLPNIELMPFVQKKVVPVGTETLHITDLHGDLHGLCDVIRGLFLDGVIGDDLHIAQGYVLVFHGDYVDSGKYGIEVLTLLSTIKACNSDKVIVVRGNHEDKFMNEKQGAQYYTLEQELNAKYPNHPNLPQLKKLIYQAYAMMPVCAYTGTQDSETGNYHYVINPHAIVDWGFNHVYLLNEPTKGFAAVLGHMNRKHVLERVLMNVWPDESERPFREHVLTNCGWDDKYKSTWKTLNNLGFCYGDLISLPAAQDQVRAEVLANAKGTPHISAWGEVLIRGFMRYYNDIAAMHRDPQGHAHYVRIIVHGHQHVARNNAHGQRIFKQVAQNGGVAVLFGSSQPFQQGRELEHGQVVVPWSAPNHELFNSDGSTEYKGSSIARITMHDGGHFSLRTGFDHQQLAMADV